MNAPFLGLPVAKAPYLRWSQRDLLQQLADGKRICEIAEHRGVGATSIDGSVALLRRKFGARTTIHLIALALQLGAVEPPRRHGRKKRK